MQYLISGGRIFTADPVQPWAEAVLIDGSELTCVGSLEQAMPLVNQDCMRIDGSHGLVVPGFVDGHVHIKMTGDAMLKAQLQDAGSLEVIRRRLLEWSDKNPDAPRILGTNWVHGDIPDAQPHRDMLDDLFPETPVYLEAFDLHSSWLNSAALDELGINDETPDPVGGRIVRDPHTGVATGHLQENASVNYVWKLLGDVTDPVRNQQMLTAVEAFVRAGITSVVEMALEPVAVDSLLRLKSRGHLPIRVVGHMIIWRNGDAEDKLRQVRKARVLADQYQGDGLRITGIKIISDGTIDACTAALSKPYTNGGVSGPIWEPEALDPVVELADSLNLQVAIHAIGDEAIHNAVNAIERTMSINQTQARRHRIEHLEYAQTRDIDRMGRLGITASMQPVHVNPAYLENWKRLLGPERANQGWAWPLYQQAGSTLAFGTDTPTAPYLALINMYLASTRKSPDHDEVPAIRPDWALPLEQAIASGTRESAWAAWLDHATGQLKTGLKADLVCLDCDVLEKGPHRLVNTNVVLTMIDGRVAWTNL